MSLHLTKTQERLIRDDFLAEIVPWKGTLYHGSELSGIACILKDGFSVGGSDWDDAEILSTSRNEAVLRLFGENSGFRFKVNFKKVLVLPEFWYALFYHAGGTGADFLDDLLEEEPEWAEKAVAMGIASTDESGRYGHDIGGLYYGVGGSIEQFLRDFMPKNIEAIMFPGFDFEGHNQEQEMAITPTGVKLLKKFTDAVIIDYQEYSWDEAKEVLEEMGVEPEECY